MSIPTKFLLWFLVFFSITSFTFSQGIRDEEISLLLADYEGVNWRCKRCGYYNYSESPDWKGDYFCLRCGTRKGDE